MTISWRDSARPVRVYFIDARLLLPAAMWVFWPSITSTAVLITGLVVFRLAETKGYRLSAAVRAVRARLAGRREALSPLRRRRFTDFG